MKSVMHAVSALVCREQQDIRYTFKANARENHEWVCDEERVAHFWWSLASETVLPLSHGGTCRVLFAGYPGSSAGPDVRDAVLLFDFPAGWNSENRERCVGDVEFHIRSSDWVAHQHHTDMRYNAVQLHVVLLCDTLDPTTCQNGTHVPVSSLFDMTVSLTSANVSNVQAEQEVYPCHHVFAQRTDEERKHLLQRAGMLRFEQKRDVFVEELHAFSAYDYHLCLVPALAEGLAYGRDRAFFRAVALRLLGLSHELPLPLGRAASPAHLDATRLSAIHILVAQAATLWPSLRKIIEHAGMNPREIILELQAWMHERGIPPTRADILLCNVVLPYAAAVALVEQDVLVEEQARYLYAIYPRLVSNRITRMMTTQLHLSAEPRGACIQQGLQYIYQQTCRAKLCDECMAGREQI